MVDCLVVNEWKAHACMDDEEIVGKKQWWEDKLNEGGIYKWREMKK